MKSKHKLVRSKAYLAGYDAGRHGPTVRNCNFSYFSTPEKTKDWSAGNKAGKRMSNIRNANKKRKNETNK